MCPYETNDAESLGGDVPLFTLKIDVMLSLILHLGRASSHIRLPFTRRRHKCCFLRFTMKDEEAKGTCSKVVHVGRVYDGMGSVEMF